MNNSAIFNEFGNNPFSFENQSEIYETTRPYKQGQLINSNGLSYVVQADIGNRKKILLVKNGLIAIPETIQPDNLLNERVILDRDLLVDPVLEELPVDLVSVYRIDTVNNSEVWFHEAGINIKLKDYPLDAIIRREEVCRLGTWAIGFEGTGAAYPGWFDLVDATTIKPLNIDRLGVTGTLSESGLSITIEEATQTNIGGGNNNSANFLGYTFTYLPTGDYEGIVQDINSDYVINRPGDVNSGIWSIIYGGSILETNPGAINTALGEGVFYPNVRDSLDALLIQRTNNIGSTVRNNDDILSSLKTSIDDATFPNLFTNWKTNSALDEERPVLINVSYLSGTTIPLNSTFPDSTYNSSFFDLTVKHRPIARLSAYRKERYVYVEYFNNSNEVSFDYFKIVRGGSNITLESVSTSTFKNSIDTGLPPFEFNENDWLSPFYFPNLDEYSAALGDGRAPGIVYPIDWDNWAATSTSSRSWKNKFLSFYKDTFYYPLLQTQGVTNQETQSDMLSKLADEVPYLPDFSDTLDLSEFLKRTGRAPKNYAYYEQKFDRANGTLASNRRRKQFKIYPIGIDFSKLLTAIIVPTN